MAYEFRNLLLLQERPKAIQVEQKIRNEKIRVWIPNLVITYRKNHPVQDNGDQHIDLKIEDWFVEKDECKLMI